SLTAFILIIRYVNRRLLNLMFSAECLARGERGVRLSEDTRIKELSQFAMAFNRIAEQLEASWHNLEEQDQVYELKRNILQVAAHEIRGPIASIKTFIDMAICHNTDKRPLDVLTTLRKCLSDISSLERHVTALLSLSALENDTLTRSDNWVQADELFAELDKQFSVRCSSKPAISWSCFPTGNLQKQVY